MNLELSINYESEQPTVSARELHEKVGSSERFSAWFERQLQFGFSENEDYVGCKTFNTLARQELQDFKLTVDMAKQICMVQKNERAKKIRQDLIDLEKAWNTPEQVMARALKMADQKIHSLQLDVERMKPKEIFADSVSASDSTILVSELAKILKANGIDTGEKRLFAYLRENGYLIKRKGTDYNMPTQKSMELRLFVIKETAINRSDGYISISKTPKVTGKGQQYFINKLLSNVEAREVVMV